MQISAHIEGLAMKTSVSQRQSLFERTNSCTQESVISL
jgi:hypothetical protein